tara:strand:- start:119 stop:1195 length:1077 start_codon:yes stop_codon:yes gene_type:complete
MKSKDLKEIVFAPLNEIANALSNMNRRIETDPSAREFKSRQVRQSITGRTLNSLMQINDEALLSSLMGTITPFESHLSLKRALDINCHSPQLQSNPRLNALELHGKESICNDCVHEQKVSFLSSPQNPYRCWRRGHRSANFGFLFNLLLRIDRRNNSWHLSRKTRLQCTKALSHSLDAINFHRIKKNVWSNGEYEEEFGRSMAVVITVRMEELEASDGTAELTSLLSSQLLTSKHIVDSKSDKKPLHGSIEALQNTVHEILDAINDVWRGSKISLNNSVGILSGAVFNNGEDATSEVFDQAMEKNIESKQWSTHNFNSLHSRKLISMYGLEKGNWAPLKSDVAICLFLDPIVDLVVNE